MKAVAIMHIASEGPGRFSEYFDARGDELSIVRLFEGDSLPESPAGLDLVISLGGPMNVYEDETYPFLAEETEFLRRAMAADTVVIGICLGAQLIARAAGASVYRSPVKEVGWMNVSMTEKGSEDPLFAGLPSLLPVLQWHEDTFDIPPGGEHLLHPAAVPTRPSGSQAPGAFSSTLRRRAKWLPAGSPAKKSAGRSLIARSSLSPKSPGTGTASAGTLPAFSTGGLKAARA